MSRYIAADALLNNLPDDLPYKASVKRVLIQAPASDVVEVRHGEWKATVLINTPGVFKTGAPHCSECKRTAPHRTAFCPNCGAKMDKKRRTNND